jgi:RNA recognition motif-containing protein
MNIHVTNLHPNLIETDLQRLFAAFGDVDSIEIIRDKINHRSRGRAFVYMPVEKEAGKALVQLNGRLIMGKLMQLAEVKYDPTYSTHTISEKR